MGGMQTYRFGFIKMKIWVFVILLFLNLFKPELKEQLTKHCLPINSVFENKYRKNGLGSLNTWSSFNCLKRDQKY